MELAILEKKGIDESTWSALKSSVFSGAEDASIILAVDYCKARGLDILKKPCHIVPMNVRDAKSGKYAWRDVIMPGIAEQRITASRTGEYAGQESPVFGANVELPIGGQTVTVPEYCTVTVYRILNGERVPFAHTEYFEEACATTKNGVLNSMWSKRKRGQLSKCAEAGALRKAFPEELGGMNTADEMSGQDNEPRNVTPSSGIQRETPLTLETPQQQSEASHADESSEQKTSVMADSAQSEPTTPMQSVFITNVKTKKGETDKGRAWKCYTIEVSLGVRTGSITTFSKTKGELALKNVNKYVLVSTNKTDKGAELIDLKEVTQPVEGGQA